MKFKKWLKLREAASGRSRRASTDLTNLAIGKIGPYGTFGAPQSPSITQQALGHLVGGVGSRMNKLLGPVEAFPHLVNLKLNIRKDAIYVDYQLPLQLPYLETPQGELVPFIQSKNFTNDQVRNIRYVRSKLLNQDPRQDPRIRKNKADGSGDFDPDPNKLLVYNEKNDEKVEALKTGSTAKQIAEYFTMALAAVIVSNDLISQFRQTGENKQYDIDNPISKIHDISLSGNGFVLRVAFVCKRKKTAADTDDSQLSGDYT